MVNGIMTNVLEYKYKNNSSYFFDIDFLIAKIGLNADYTGDTWVNDFISVNA